VRDLVRQIVEGYKSVKLVGQDEGYVVFTGLDPDTQQAVSIKVLPRLLGREPQAARKFEAFSRALRQLNHPNIVAVRQVGARAGMPYIVTAAAEKGGRLASALDREWAIEDAADLVMQAGRGLEHAYNKGVVHGDLTPESIVLEDKGRVMVTDFGLRELMEMVGARAQDEDSPYIAPERAAGKPASPRSDVYSLAAILYRLLTGRSPQIVKGEVLPPSRFNPDLPPGIDPVVVRALARNPLERFPDVKAFLASLGGVALARRVQAPASADSEGRTCPHCGTPNQTSRYCRKCGAQLEQPAARTSERRRPEPPAVKAPGPSQPALRPPPGVPQRRRPPPRAESKLDEPIQITTIDVGHVDIGTGVELQKTVIAQPMSVASSEISAEFPAPLPMPELKVSASGLFAADFDQPPVAMPEPPEMPVIDWAEVAPRMPEVPTIEDVRLEQERLQQERLDQERP
jgi:serine/threonine protein kinase